MPCNPRVFINAAITDASVMAAYKVCQVRHENAVHALIGSTNYHCSYERKRSVCIHGANGGDYGHGVVSVGLLREGCGPAP
jgi:hypothetical protein